MEATAPYEYRETAAADDDDQDSRGYVLPSCGTYGKRAGALWKTSEGNLVARNCNDYLENIRKIFDTFKNYYSIQLTNRIG